MKVDTWLDVWSRVGVGVGVGDARDVVCVDDGAVLVDETAKTICDVGRDAVAVDEGGGEVRGEVAALALGGGRGRARVLG